MRASYVALALLAGSVVYLAGALVASPYRSESFQALEAHLARLESNIEDLQTHHNELVARAELYRRSPDAVTVEARRLQYYLAGQSVVRIGNAASGRVTESPGTILQRPARSPDRRDFVRVAALIAFLLTLLLQLVLEARALRDQEMRRASR
jgi:hypothetical protein